MLLQNFQTKVYCLRSIFLALEVYIWAPYQYIYAIFIVVLAIQIHILTHMHSTVYMYSVLTFSTKMRWGWDNNLLKDLLGKKPRLPKKSRIFRGKNLAPENFFLAPPISKSYLPPCKILSKFKYLIKMLKVENIKYFRFYPRTIFISGIVSLNKKLGQCNEF